MGELPDEPGTYPAGAIQITCSGGTKVIMLHVKKGETVEPIYQPISPQRLVSSIVRHEAAGSKYEFLPTWKHEECIVLDETSTLYIKGPPVDKNWPNDWSLRLVENSIPLELWRKLKDSPCLDRMRPWFVKDQPTHLKGCMFFKPLAATFNGDLTETLKQISQVTASPAIQVATLLYETYNKIHVPSDNGMEDNTHRVRRRLYIYVKLPAVETATLIPIKMNNKCFDVDNDSVVDVKLGCEFQARVRPKIRYAGDDTRLISRWTIGEFDTGVDFFGSSQTDFDSFRFKATKVGDHHVRLKCGQEILKFRVSVTH
jgi:hypothetical protein